MSIAIRHGRGRLLAAAMVVAVVALSAGPAPARAAPLQTGLVDIDAFRLGDPLAFSRARGAGARYVRIPVSWAATAPSARPAAWSPGRPADPRYQWGNLDT